MQVGAVFEVNTDDQLVDLMRRARVDVAIMPSGEAYCVLVSHATIYPQAFGLKSLAHALWPGLSTYCQVKASAIELADVLKDKLAVYFLGMKYKLVGRNWSTDDVRAVVQPIWGRQKNHLVVSPRLGVPGVLIYCHPALREHVFTLVEGVEGPYTLGSAIFFVSDLPQDKTISALSVFADFG